MSSDRFLYCPDKLASRPSFASSRWMASQTTPIPPDGARVDAYFPPTESPTSALYVAAIPDRSPQCASARDSEHSCNKRVVPIPRGTQMIRERRAG